MRPSRGMGAILKGKMPSRGGTASRKDAPGEADVYAKGGKTIPKKARPPKKAVGPRLGLPMRQFKPRVPPKEFV